MPELMLKVPETLYAIRKQIRKIILCIEGNAEEIDKYSEVPNCNMCDLSLKYSDKNEYSYNCPNCIINATGKMQGCLDQLSYPMDKTRIQFRRRLMFYHHLTHFMPRGNPDPRFDTIQQFHSDIILKVDKNSAVDTNFSDDTAIEISNEIIAIYKNIPVDDDQLLLL